MKHILLSATLVVLSISANAQTSATNSTCQVALNKSPSVRGIKLGMKLDDVLRLFPRAEENEQIRLALQQKTNYPNLGIIQFWILPSNYSTKEFVGISSFSFVFLDDRLAQYSVEYSSPPDGPAWRRLDDWITKVAESFDLPAVSNWTVEPNYGGNRLLRCNGFQVRASNLNMRGNLQVATFELPYKEQESRREAFEEKLRRDFKP
jgi:hypothetical protein